MKNLATSDIQWLRALPTRRGAILGLIAPLVLIVCMIEYRGWKDEQALFNQLVIQRQQQVSDRIHAQLKQFTQVSHQAAISLTQAIQRGELDPINLKTWGPYLYDQGEMFDRLSHLSFQNIAGDLVTLRQPLGRKDRVTWIDHRRPDQVALLSPDRSSPPVIQTSIEQDYLDPNAWEQSSLSEQPQWTELNQASGAPRTLRLVRPYVQTNQTRQGLIETRITLTDISQALSQIPISPSGVAFIMNKQGTLLATSQAESPRGTQHDARNASSAAIIPTTQAYLRQTYPTLGHITQAQFLRFEAAGQRQLLHISPFTDEFGLDWLTMVVIPETDFTEIDNPHNQLTRLFEVVVLGLIILSIVLLAFQKTLEQKNHVLQNLLEENEDRETALQESEAKFATFFQKSPIPLSICSIPDGRYLDINEEFSQKTGYSREEIIGKTPLELNFWVSLQERAHLLELMQAQGYARNIESHLRHKSGAIKEVLLSLEIIQLNNRPYHLIAAKDITDHKITQRSLAAQSRELTKTLRTLKETQSQLIESAKMAALGNLVAGVAHEINTPIGTAVMMASTLENSTQAIASEVTNKTLTQSQFNTYLGVATEASQLILDNLNRAGELVQSFKQVAVDQTSLQMRTFALKPYLEEVLMNLSVQIKQTSHIVTILGNDTITIQSYPGALSQIMSNLIINSLTHAFPTHKSGRIQIEVQQQDNHCILIYQDDGVGIPAENLDKIFEPFFTTARNKGGSGLGLNVVYNLVTQKLNGTITVNSVRDQGAIFTIHLPLAAPPNGKS